MTYKTLVMVGVIVLVVAFVAVAVAQLPTARVGIELPRIPDYIRRAAPNLAIMSAQANAAEGNKMFDVEVVVKNKGLAAYRPSRTCKARVALWLGAGYELLRLLGSEEVPTLRPGESTTLHINLHMPSEGGVWVILQWDANPRDDREIIYFVY